MPEECEQQKKVIDEDFQISDGTSWFDGEPCDNIQLQSCNTIAGDVCVPCSFFHV